MPLSSTEAARSSLLSDQLRNELQLAPQLGAGNFIRYAYEINPNRDLPNVFLHCPIQILDGTKVSSFSIASLKEIADLYAAWYLWQGIKPKDPVGVYFSEGGRYLVHYTALTSIGAIPILTNGGMPFAVAAQHFRRTGAVGIFTDEEHIASLEEHLDIPGLKFITTDARIATEALPRLPLPVPFEHDSRDPIMITHSSGTTGVPKAVLLQHGKWFYGIRHLLGLPPAQGGSRYLSALPSSHNSAIAYAIHAILNGSELIIMADRSGRAAGQAIQQYRPSMVVSFPQTFVELSDVHEDYDLDSVSAWINSGDAAHETHIRKLVSHGFHYRGNERIPGAQFIDGLGSSEMGHSSFRVIHTRYTNNYDRCIGLPQKWVDAAVLDDQGNAMPTGSVGKLGIKSESITEGYWNDSLLTHRSRLRGYFLTGDLAYKDHMGCFYHVDRITDAVLTREGWFYTLQNEELLMKHHEVISDCSIVGLPGADGYQALWVLVMLREGIDLDEAGCLALFNATLQKAGRPLLSRVVRAGDDALPIGITGKVLKATLREKLKKMPDQVSGE